MEHHFDIEVAKKVGVNAAVIFKNICCWVEKNAANEKHFYDGYYWTYNSVKAFNSLFPYLTPRQIRTALDKLENDGFIKSGNYNKSSHDRTKWYCIARQFDLSEMSNGFDTNVKPIPDNKLNNNTDNKRFKEKINKKEKFNFKKSLLDLGVEEQYIDDWLKVRKKKKASNTETAFDAFRNECVRNNFDYNEAVKFSAQNSYSGFKFEWIKSLKPEIPTKIEVWNFLTEIEMKDKVMAATYYDSRESTGWKKNGTPITDWEADIRNFVRNYITNNQD